MSQRKKLIADAKQWVKQEQVWGEQMYATSSPTSLRPLPSSPRVVSGDPSLLTSKDQALLALYAKYENCVRCPLGPTRIKIVFGVGNANSEVLFIGEGPGYEEDRRGEPFVGKSGQLLDKMMAAIGLSRQTNAYIANIVKCHPMVNPQTPEARGNDRPPTQEEVLTCSPILLQQIAIMKPKVIMTLGSPSTKMVLHTKEAITALRGKMVSFDVNYFYPETTEMPELKMDAATRAALRHTKVIPTYHPAALLRNPNLKGDAWTDLKLLRATLAH